MYNEFGLKLHKGGVFTKLNDIMKFEKASMNKIRYIVNYRIAPVYALITVICLVMIGILMEADESRYTPVAIGLFVFIGVMTVVLLASIPYTRKLEIKAELKCYDFDTSSVESKDVYDFSDEEVSFRFDKNRMYINNTFYWYNHLRIIVNTSNYLNRIWIMIMFFINESDYGQVLLNGDTLNMVEKFNINLVNRETLDFIVNHKEEAFDRIYKKGHF